MLKFFKKERWLSLLILMCTFLVLSGVLLWIDPSLYKKSPGSLSTFYTSQGDEPLPLGLGYSFISLSADLIYTGPVTLTFPAGMSTFGNPTKNPINLANVVFPAKSQIQVWNGSSYASYAYIASHFIPSLANIQPGQAVFLKLPVATTITFNVTNGPLPNDSTDLSKVVVVNGITTIPLSAARRLVAVQGWNGASFTMDTGTEIIPAYIGLFVKTLVSNLALTFNTDPLTPSEDCLYKHDGDPCDVGTCQGSVCRCSNDANCLGEADGHICNQITHVCSSCDPLKTDACKNYPTGGLCVFNNQSLIFHCGCQTMTDCLNTPLKPFCSNSLHKCVECLGNPDCKIPGINKCDTSTGKCVQCFGDSDCANGLVCGDNRQNQNMCVMCNTSDDCARMPGGINFCTASSICAPCSDITNDGCANGKICRREPIFSDYGCVECDPTENDVDTNYNLNCENSPAGNVCDSNGNCGRCDTSRQDGITGCLSDQTCELNKTTNRYECDNAAQ